MLSLVQPLVLQYDAMSNTESELHDDAEARETSRNLLGVVLSLEFDFMRFSEGPKKDVNLMLHLPF